MAWQSAPTGLKETWPRPQRLQVRPITGQDFHSCVGHLPTLPVGLERGGLVGLHSLPPSEETTGLGAPFYECFRRFALLRPCALVK